LIFCAINLQARVAKSNLADAINTQAANNAVEAVTLNGRRFDCGSVQGYLDAIMHVADRRKR
jgi:UTP--glucose-1-phosphate uridylyltransferase